MSMKWSTGIILKTLTVGCAVGLLFVAPPATRAQEASGEIAIGFPDGVSILNSGDDPGVVEESTVDVTPTCTDPGGCVTVKLAVHNTKPTFVSAYVEYNTSTCAEISPGGWGQTKAPAHGKLSNSTFTGHLSNGACASTTFTFGELVYTANKVTETLTRDSFRAFWTTSDYPTGCPTCKVGLTAHVRLAD